MKLNFFRSVQKSLVKNSYLGLDIGTASIKLVEIADEHGKPRLVNYGILETRGHLERINNAIQTSSLEMLDTETVEIIAALVKQVNPKTNEVIASLPAFSAFTAVIDLPDMAAEEITQAMEYQAKNIVPIPISEITIDWATIGKKKDQLGNTIQEVFLIAVPNKQIKKYQVIFEKAGLNLHTLELETVSLARILTKGDKTVTLIIDIGARSTAMLIAADGALMHSSQVDFAGTSLTGALSKGLGINTNRAEELKKQKGLMGMGGEYEVSTLMVPYLDVILNEAKRAKENFEQSRQRNVERIILSGGGANLLGVEKHVSEYFNLPAIKAEPFGAKISYPSSFAPLAKEVGPSLSVALGLGAKDFLDKNN